ncbi:leucyl-tRNA synthetase [Patellaria atrata CBS 101060]|uniref:leucine--tRNA ligase n=1 Tax=Patellaria atrata CBS 101060 TaxID=1346257 RepID=A0A9P4SBU3_9PEZI|nr:leucyl-tRNA synthetase [Patellaria atrata CBS 101060]
MKLENTEKRDTQIANEYKAEKKWEESRIFEYNPPTPEQLSSKEVPPEGEVVTMAYPYMNGILHLGHAFTASKVEFAAGFKRMQGKNILYAQGYHCTGMPIKACADKLVREIDLFGQNFERCTLKDLVEEELETAPAPTQSDTKEDVTKFGSNKSKAAAKNIKTKYQFQIMLSIGVPLEEIHKFADPQYWLEYFPPRCRTHLQRFGARIDWRRQFVTTDANPYYDAFVRWQMNRLKELGKIKFGKRYTIYSPKDGQPCMDHDRSSGEGVGVQEYTALKLLVKEWPEAIQTKISNSLPGDAKVYFVPATLRPETMYGQNCCFVGPNLTYGIFKAAENEYYFLSPRSARNMAYQGLFPEWGVFPQVAELKGKDVIGTLVNAPLSVHKDGVRILPMETVKDSKGTGVVTCVPSDSPDDYATIMDLTKKADYYGIKKEWAELEILPLIETPSYGNLTAKALVEKFKINGPKDTKLAEAKELAYKEGFYQGKMIYGEFSGRPVSEAKNLVKQKLIDSGDAFNYGEPDGQVISRSSDVCVAGLLDQWYLNYGSDDAEWRDTVLDWVNNDLETFQPEVKHQFQQTIDWLNQWACARTYGLGSQLPWDHTFLVESLSDSAIYPAYYTIAHYLHKEMFGKEPGILGIKPEQMTDDVWDFVFARTDEKPQTDISEDALQTLRQSFEYYYPTTFRASGKDLIQNHLTFYLYVHTALFPRKYWPKAIRCNGHLLLNGLKMSKSTGNFLTLEQAIEKFSADATRVALADAGDGMEDANFEESVANAVILKLYTLREWCEEMIRDARVVESADQYAKVIAEEKLKSYDIVQRTGERLIWDVLFENEINSLVRETEKSYTASWYKAALKSGFYDFTAARDFYREATKAAGVGMHKDVITRYVELQALMIQVPAPHWAEHIWSEVLKKDTSSQESRWPSVPEPDAKLTAIREYVRTTSSNITSAEGLQQKKLAKGKSTSYAVDKDKRLTIFVAKSFPAWQDKLIDLARGALEGLSLDIKKIVPKIPKPETKRSMPFLQSLKKSLDSGVSANNTFNRSLSFDELEILNQMVPGLKQTVRLCKEVILVSVTDEGKSGVVVGQDGKEGERKKELPPQAASATPGSPTFAFENI